jgi:DNA polymerase III sliding clamp (beta) subunit (PCNA family)
MQFTLSRASVQAIAQQLLKTCNAKNEKSKLDGYIYFEVIEEADPHSTTGGKRSVLTAATTNGAADQVVTVPTVTLSANVGDGFFVEAVLFSEFLKTFSHDEIKCALKGRKGAESDLIIGSSEKNTYLTLPTIPKNNYAPVHFTPKGGTFALDGKALGKALRLTAFSAATDHKRPAITAVKLTVSGDKLIAVSTDYHRISRMTVEIEDANVQAEFLVPRVSAEILGALLANVETVTVVPGRSHLRVSWEGATFTTSLEMSGAAFPPVEQFLETSLISTAKLSRGELLSGLKVTGLIAKDTYVNLDLSPEEGLMISAKQRNGTTTEVTVVVQEADAQADSIVAYKHLKGAVDVIGTAFLTMEFRQIKEDLAPILKDDEGFEHIVLPMDPNDGDDAEDAADGDGGAEEDQDDDHGDEE